MFIHIYALCLFTLSVNKCFLISSLNHLEQLEAISPGSETNSHLAAPSCEGAAGSEIPPEAPFLQAEPPQPPLLLLTGFVLESPCQSFSRKLCQVRGWHWLVGRAEAVQGSLHCSPHSEQPQLTGTFPSKPHRAERTAQEKEWKNPRGKGCQRQWDWERKERKISSFSCSDQRGHTQQQYAKCCQPGCDF